MDGYPGIMKGVILSITHQVQIVDITHDIPPQNIMAGTLAAGRAYSYFPGGTIHIIVVDPGVGTSRRSIAAQIGDQYFICPDNGLITIPLQNAEKHHQASTIINLNNPQFWLPNPSMSFHGRDIFAPVAAHLATGVPLSMMGEVINDPVLLKIPAPIRIDNIWCGQIIHIDHFGNLTTNFTKEEINTNNIQIQIGSHIINGISQTFGSNPPGSLIAIWDSSDHLSICIVNGNANDILSIGLDDSLTIIEIK